MNIEATKARHVEHGLRQDQAIGRNDHHRRTNFRNLCLRVGVLQGLWLKYLDPVRHRHLLDSRRLQGHAAAGRAVRLGQHQGHLVTGRDDRGQRLGSKSRRSGKNQLHAVTRACLASLLRMRVCLSCER